MYQAPKRDSMPTTCYVLCLDRHSPHPRCLPLWPFGPAALPGLFPLCRWRLVCIGIWHGGSFGVATVRPSEGRRCFVFRQWSTVGRVPVCGCGAIPVGQALMQVGNLVRC